jgi:hypothetical protein
MSIYQTGNFIAAIRALKGEDTFPIMTTRKARAWISMKSF